MAFILVIASTIIAFGIAVFIWPTAWVYETEMRRAKPHKEPIPVTVRYSRFDGRKQTFFADKWYEGEIEFKFSR